MDRIYKINRINPNTNRFEPGLFFAR